jgi:uncharacterized protein (DUF433 family)
VPGTFPVREGHLLGEHLILRHAPHQTGVEIEMMSELITEVVNGKPYQYYPLGEHVVRAMGVCGGRPTFKYTRIEISGALDRLAAGESLEEIVAGYRGRVSREAVREAVQVVTSGFLRTLPALEPA